MRRFPSTQLQRDMILSALLAGKTITASMARQQWGCYRLAGRIIDLRRAGYKIVVETLIDSDGKAHEARYRLHVVQTHDAK